jgi:truncated hemoglobin YjbI
MTQKTKLQKIFSEAIKELTKEALSSFLTYAYGSLSCAIENGYKKEIPEKVLRKRLNELKKDKENIYLKV